MIAIGIADTTATRTARLRTELWSRSDRSRESIHGPQMVADQRTACLTWRFPQRVGLGTS